MPWRSLQNILECAKDTWADLMQERANRKGKAVRELSSKGQTGAADGRRHQEFRELPGSSLRWNSEPRLQGRTAGVGSRDCLGSEYERLFMPPEYLSLYPRASGLQTFLIMSPNNKNTHPTYGYYSFVCAHKQHSVTIKNMRSRTRLTRSKSGPCYLLAI